MAVLDFQPPNATLPPGTTNTSTVSNDTSLPTFQFIASWLLLIVLMTLISKSRVGYVIIYYSLLLMILLILVTEYQQITPLLDIVQTIGQFNKTNNTGA